MPTMFDQGISGWAVRTVSGRRAAASPEDLEGTDQCEFEHLIGVEIGPGP